MGLHLAGDSNQPHLTGNSNQLHLTFDESSKQILNKIIDNQNEIINKLYQIIKNQNQNDDQLNDIGIGVVNLNENLHDLSNKIM
jgi:hypothetical protein